MSGIIAPSDVLKGIPPGLRDPLLDEYNKIVRNYREGRWEPAELNGGKLCEVVYSILKGHVDSSFPAAPTKPSNMVAACQSLEQAPSANFPRSVRIQIPRMVLGLYEIRNNRNVGHVGSDVDPNHMDATVVLHMAGWIMAELVRIFHGVTTDEATKAIDAVVDRTIPLVWSVGRGRRVLSSSLDASEKTLVLLYGSASPVAVKDLVRDIEYSNASRYRSKVLTDAHKANLIHFDRNNDTAEISPLGVRYVESQIPLHLTE